MFARALAASFLAACILATSTASAQTYPNRPIIMMVPFAPGGVTDAIARIIQDSMAKSLGQPIVVENIGGAGGMIAAGAADVFDHDRLAQRFRHAVLDDARDRVGHATGRERHHHDDGAIGVG